MLLRVLYRETRQLRPRARQEEIARLPLCATWSTVPKPTPEHREGAPGVQRGEDSAPAGVRATAVGGRCDDKEQARGGSGTRETSLESNGENGTSFIDFWEVSPRPQTLVTQDA